VGNRWSASPGSGVILTAAALRKSALHTLPCTRDEARRIALNIAKLPELQKGPAGLAGRVYAGRINGGLQQLRTADRVRR
jgi:hypothetical protein